MSFDIISTLEIPQGATELTTSELKQISGGWRNSHNDHKKCHKFHKEHKKRCKIKIEVDN